MMPTVSSFADIRRLAADLPAADSAAAEACAAREARLTKPGGALGRLEDVSSWLCAWQGGHPPRAARPRCVVFAGNHGVAARGVSAFPAEVTVQMVTNFEAGGAAINQLCAAFGTELAVVALDLDRPTADFTAAPAMSEAECVAAFAAGMAAVGDCDLLCLGEMGIANTSAAAAVAAGLFGGPAAEWCGKGTGVEGEAMRRKVEAVAAGLERHLPADPLEVLARLGGRELAAMAGAAFGARFARVPVLLDGYVCTAAAAVLEALRPGALDHCLVAHCSAEPGHRRLVQRLGKAPLFDLGMRLGEASGAALAVGVVKAAAACHTGMATFGEAGVSDAG